MSVSGDHSDFEREDIYPRDFLEISKDDLPEPLEGFVNPLTVIVDEECVRWVHSGDTREGEEHVAENLDQVEYNEDDPVSEFEVDELEPGYTANTPEGFDLYTNTEAITYDSEEDLENILEELDNYATPTEVLVVK